ncbi:MAG: disulfide bond formation protein DsbD [Ferruginibacter sp.]|nr:disulfide bond formation protein DsbD [Ferruginibacter sp.]
MRSFISRSFWFLFLFVSSLATFAQDSTHVTWTAVATKTGAGNFQLSVKGKIASSWHIYQADKEQDLAGVVVHAPDSGITLSRLSLSTATSVINDPVFEKQMTIFADSISGTQTLTIAGEVPGSIKLKINYEAGTAGNFLPEEQTLVVNLEGGVTKVVSNRILIPTIDIKHPLTNAGASATSGENKSRGLMSLFILGFLGGLVALLTPCVFPMIPLTVSFFTKKAQSRKAGISNAFLYGFFIFFIYVLLSLPFHFLDKLNPEILNNISTNVILNVIFFVVFIAFALSFFGLYEITLPSSVSNTADSKAGVGNVIGIFFMALTLAVVSFSCTGPILGSLLAGSLSADGGAMQLTSGMAGFGLALALPFALFALFPHWLNSLPKSGGWLTTVKVVLGFIELGLAFKFLSNADLVKHWGLLKREVFIGIWVLIGICLSLYLFGILKFKHDSPIKKLSFVRICFGILVAAFTIYLLPGLTNTKAANLKLISGFPPPLYYSMYKSGHDCVLDLNCSRDYEEGLQMAREQNKPILIDFTGYACVNCRRMEENVWSKPEVYQLMKEKYIVISLYVDDKKKLPSSQQFTYTTKDGVRKEIETVGDKWATFETENFANNAQPWYAILNSQEQLLTFPVGYTPSSKEYLSWLQAGVDAFYKK